MKKYPMLFQNALGNFTLYLERHACGLNPLLGLPGSRRSIVDGIQASDLVKLAVANEKRTEQKVAEIDGCQSASSKFTDLREHQVKHTSSSFSKNSGNLRKRVIPFCAGNIHFFEIIVRSGLHRNKSCSIAIGVKRPCLKHSTRRTQKVNKVTTGPKGCKKSETYPAQPYFHRSLTSYTGVNSNIIPCGNKIPAHEHNLTRGA